ncbi:uncharacterized protein Nmag_1661 [Natrialba magadii ATCC 43099]|uniref:Uncharacterized protein n=1 Tax=Natrialba magadii (strain ATCC 43099 / DSM 3394 / CCM 3739 / CIP 104546 / IAM 13178 / JCM 8861 / NBRC 102185 / NCIMB 2190 / MS3) TaxID=547559 RepID=D3SUH9_NATMM|nr:uncharacterized protein Nmag_1661 [Natrialba magadii ATCC 43099]
MYLRATNRTRSGTHSRNGICVVTNRSCEYIRTLFCDAKDITYARTECPSNSLTSKKPHNWKMDTVPASVPGNGQRERGGVRHVVRINDEERVHT